MAKDKKDQCVVPGCASPQHAKGYCNTHYGQMWRKGEISPEKKSKSKNIKDAAKTLEKRRRDRQERLDTLQREFNRARSMYEIVVGFEGRMKWRKEMDSVKEEIEKLLGETEEDLLAKAAVEEDELADIDAEIDEEDEPGTKR